MFKFLFVLCFLVVASSAIPLLHPKSLGYTLLDWTPGRTLKDVLPPIVSPVGVVVKSPPSVVGPAPPFVSNPALTSTSWSKGDFWLAFFKDGAGVLATLNSTAELMVDPANSRFAVDLPSLGKQWTFANGTYFVIPLPGGGSICAFTNKTIIGNTSATYDGQVVAYQRSLQVDSFLPLLKRFNGFVLDIGACIVPLGQEQYLVDSSNAHYSVSFSQQQPGTPSPSGCAPAFASVETGIIRTPFAVGFLPSNSSAFFQLPVNCFAPYPVLDYCRDLICYSCVTQPCD
jgi:hypothetical protein